SDLALRDGGRAALPERVADGDDRVADLEVRGVGERDGRQARDTAVDLQERDVVGGRNADYVRAVVARSPSDRDRDADGAVDDVVVGEHLARRGDDHPGAGRGAIAVRRLDDRVDVDYCGVDFGRDGRRVDGAVAVQRRDSRDWRAPGRRLA